MSNTDTLRPETWAEYVGQEAVKAELEIRIQAALKRGEPMAHVLLCATPGTGKTALASIIAARLRENMVSVIASADLSLTGIVSKHQGVLFVDELHRLSARKQEELLPLLEFGYLQGRGRRIEAGWLTVLAATTERDKILPALKDRFPIEPHFDPYSDADLALIGAGMAFKAGLELPPDCLTTLAGATGGVPRVMRSFILAARDLADDLGRIPEAKEVLGMLRYDDDGLNADHIEYLGALDTMGGRAGLSVLANYLKQNEQACRDIERLLIQRGMLEFLPGGRSLTEVAYRRLHPKQAM